MNTTGTIFINGIYGLKKKLKMGVYIKFTMAV